MVLIDRYMSAVAHYLPGSRREEIVRELHANILDRLEHLADEQGSEPSDADVSAILKDLGHPKLVATRFLPQRCLVSEELFPLYKQVLGYAVILVFMVQVIKLSVIFLGTQPVNMLGMLLGYSWGVLLGFLHNMLLAFAAVTGVFYSLSNPPTGKPYFKPYSCWSPDQLPPITYEWQRISTCEQATEIFSSVFFLLVLYHQFWIPVEDLQNVFIEFSDAVWSWVPLLTGIVLVSLALKTWSVHFAFWTLPKLMLNIILNLLTAVIFLSMRDEVIWLAGAGADPDEVSRVLGILNVSFNIGFLIAGLWLLYEVVRDIYRIWILKRLMY